MWWFDMWGGWYKNNELMSECTECRRLMGELIESGNKTTRSQVAVLFDEKLTFRLGTENKCIDIQKRVSEALGQTGVPFDTFITEDYKACADYDVVLLAFPEIYDTAEATTIKSFLRENRIPYIQVSEDDISTKTLRNTLIDCGAHCYIDTGDVIYCGNGMLAIHAATAGKKEICLPCGSTITTDCKQYETKIFMI
jgi:hypothetical protein